MRTLFLAASAMLTLLAGGPATAADMPARAPMYKAQPPVAYSWTGLYVGGHLGAGWATNEWRAVEIGGSNPFRLGTGNPSGFLGGAQIGVNYQVDAVVFGFEAEVSWASLTGETCNAVAATVQCNSKSDRFGTLAGRFGIAADRTLVYFKGGAAWTHDIHDLVLCCGVVEATVSGGKWGWMAGTGLEYVLTRNWSAKLEYDFMDFGTSRFVFDLPAVGGTGTATTEIKQRIHALKFGWNYKFDWSAPVAANY